MRSTGEPLVSVVMATYNTEYAMLREAVESVIAQTYKNWELILIDDCSTKNNDLSFIDEYQDERIRVVRNGENLGCTKCFNKGIRLARGTYIARLDADDVSLPQRFALQVEYMEKHPDIKVLSGRALYIGDDRGSSILVPNNLKYLRAYMLFYNCIPHSSVMMRRSMFEDGMYYDENFRYAQDYDLWTRLLETGDHIAHLPKCIVKIRIHGDQISTSERRTEQCRLISGVSRRELSKIYDVTSEDIVLRDSLIAKKMAPGCTVGSLNSWILKVIELNCSKGVLDRHYLKLAFARRYVPFMAVNKSSGCMGFMVKHMFPEFIETVLIQMYRGALGLIYSLKYGR